MRVLILAALFLCHLSASLPAQREPTSSLLIILVPGLRADDLTRPEAEGLRRFVDTGAVGWMNCRTARVPGQRTEPQEAAYVTLGAGSRATAGTYARQRTAATLARLKSENARLDHPVTVGALGDLLRSAGVHTDLIGHEDDTEPRRAASWVVADSHGRIDTDRSGSFPADFQSVESPFGVAHSSHSLRAIGAAASRLQRDVTVFNYGDLARADRYARYCTPDMADRHRGMALKKLTDNVFHDYLETGYTTQRWIVLLAPHAADSAGKGDRLAPIMIWGAGVPSGLLTSGSTRTEGLVTNTDFLPTIAGLLGLKAPAGMVGRPMTVKELRPEISWLDRAMSRLGLKPLPSFSQPVPTPEMWAKMHNQWYARSRQQAQFGGMPVVQAVAILLSLAAGWYAARGGGRAASASRLREALLLIPLWLPAILLFLPHVAPKTVTGAGAVLGAAILTPVVIYAVRPARWLIAAPLFALLVGISLDLLSGTPLLREAWMSYSVMEGARYYGIGNEYCGALLSAGLGAALFVRRVPAWGWTVVLVLLSVLVAWPGGGANAGGFLGLIIGFGAAALVWMRGRIGLREILLLFAAAVVAMAAWLLIDLARDSGAQSHIARAVGEGPLQIALRKLELNAWLLTRSPWSLLLIVAGSALLAQWRRDPNVLRSSAQIDRRLAGVCAGIFAGALALLLLNDSGVVAAAEALSVACAVLALARPLEQIPQQRDRASSGLPAK